MVVVVVTEETRWVGRGSAKAFRHGLVEAVQRTADMRAGSTSHRVDWG